jgi:hypothetical protein
MLSDEKKQKLLSLIDQAEANGESPEFIQNELIPAFKQKHDVVEPVVSPQEDKGLIQRGLEYAGKTIAGAFQHPIETVKGLGYGAAKSVAGMATDAAAMVNPDENEDINMTMPGRFPMQAQTTNESSSDIIKRRENLASQAVTPITENLTPQESRAAKIGELLVPASAGEIALGKPVGALIGKTLGAAGKLLPKATTEAEKLDKVIQEGISKGVKPTVVGKPSLAKMEGFYDNAKRAVRTISENRADIKILNDAGEVVSHPKTSGEFAQAIDQAKKKIYDKYHEMSINAGDSGSSFDLSKVRSELNKISSPNNIKMNPKVREYAKSLSDELEELDGAPPEVIESRIADLNNSLAGFYDGRVTKAQAQVDASVAKLMREELDNKITNAVGEGYQDLKNQYGALKAIEKEVNKRALVNARQNVKSFTDLTDIFTGGEIVSGIISMNPALIAKGVASRGIKEIYKNINKPDRYIERMFRKAYKDIPEAVEGVQVLNKPITDKSRLLPYQMVGENPQPIPKETVVNGQRTVKTDMEIPVGSKIRNLGESGAPEFDYKEPPVKPAPLVPKQLTDRSAKALPPPMIGKSTQEPAPAIASRGARAREIDRRVAELGKVDDLKGKPAAKLTTFEELATRHKDPFNYADPDAKAKPANEPHIYTDDPRVKDLLTPAEYKKLVKEENARIKANKSLLQEITTGDIENALTPDQLQKKSMMQYEKHMNELNAPKIKPEVEKKGLVKELVKKLGVGENKVVFKDLSTDKKQVILDLVNRLNSSSQEWNKFYDRGILDKPYIKGESNIHQDDIVDMINSMNASSLKNIRTK